MRGNLRLFCAGLALIATLLFARGAEAQAGGDKGSVVKVVEEQGKFRLVRNGQPYFIKGAGGDGDKKLLHDLGANSFRTWGADDLDQKLDEAQRLGLTVTIGIWLGHKEHGFNYNNADQVAAQYESARKAILKYRNHPALLMWGIGNEMEASDPDNAAMWSAVNNIAALAKKLDPNHPTMTVIAELGGEKVKHIHRLCPDIDVVGINSYAGGPSVGERYRKLGGTKPYVLTEFGPAGIWETAKNDIGTFPEPTSTAKAESYRKTYLGSIQENGLSLGSYAFTWGNKQEATATWFGLLLPDGSRLGATDVLSELWTGKPVAHPCPNLRSLKLDSDEGDPGKTVRATLDVTPGGSSSEPLQVKWVLQSDAAKFNSNGDNEQAPPTFADAILHSDSKGAEVRLPKYRGIYRLFAYVRDTHGGAAVANVPMLVRGGEAAPNAALAAGKPVTLPFTVYAEGKQPGLAFVPSGYMGNHAAVKIDEECTTNPHGGKLCMKVDYQAKDNWAGVVWQSPANDWGDQPGGRNLTGASRLTFWARGAKGGEVVNFLCGIIKKDKPFFDTAQTGLDKVTLTADWKQYTIDLKGKDLSRIKTGFGWSLAASGEPITFYLDDIKFE